MGCRNKNEQVFGGKHDKYFKKLKILLAFYFERLYTQDEMSSLGDASGVIMWVM